MEQTGEQLIQVASQKTNGSSGVRQTGFDMALDDLLLQNDNVTRLHFVHKCILILEPESPVTTEHLLQTCLLHADLRLQLWTERAMLKPRTLAACGAWKRKVIFRATGPSSKD
ncbi:hypothetical protein PoB_001159700 [Plakobranchus ocellatus]|uniref:BTB domain-containing protein n=1 Tax=Plakobranchus ocellatus TaxID=259542 RepID=A0AAV3YRH4_9GAST|nr:hypothetical protein PoB_001159700 [Plakobranchus ocellatus]